MGQWDVHLLHMLRNIGRKWHAQIRPVWTWLVSGGECFLIKAPAASSHRAPVVLGFLVHKRAVVERCQDRILHAVDIIWVGLHSYSVISVSVFIFFPVNFPNPWPPSVTPAFFPDDANLRRAVWRRLAFGSHTPPSAAPRRRTLACWCCG